MSAEIKTAPRQHRVDISLRVDLKYPDREAFVEGFSQNVSRTGIFVRSREPAPVGSRVRFEYRVADGTRILRGVGVVRWARTPSDTQDPQSPPGMGIEFVDLDAESEELVHRVVALHGEGARAPKRAGRARAHVGGATQNADIAKGSAPSSDEVALNHEEQQQLDSLLCALDEPPAFVPTTAFSSGGDADASSVSVAPAGAEPATPATVPSAWDETTAESINIPEFMSTEDTPQVDGEQVARDDMAPPDIRAEPLFVAPAAETWSPGDSSPPSDAALEVTVAQATTEPIAAVCLPILLDGQGQPLGYPSDGVCTTASTGWPLVENAELLLDLAASQWRGAVVPRGTAFGDVGDAVWVTAGEGDEAQALPSPLGWLVDPWPAPRAQVIARRLGLTLVDDGSGFPAVSWRQLSLSSAAIVQNGLEKVMSACAAHLRPHHARVVLPACVNNAARRLVLRSLAGLGVSRSAVVTSPAAAMRSTGSSGSDAATLVVETLAVETRLTLLAKDGSILAMTATLDSSYMRSNSAVAQRLAALQPVPSNQELKSWFNAWEDVASRARGLSPGVPWQVRLGARTIEIEPAMVLEVLAESNESLALSCDLLMRTHGLDSATASLVVVPEAPLWPGLAEGFGRVLGKMPTILSPDPWLRLRGLGSADLAH